MISIIKKEILSQLLTFRFTFITVLSVILISLCTFLNVQTYEEKLTNYNLAIHDQQQELTNVEVYSQIRPKIELPPEVLSILNKGVYRQFSTTITVSRDKVPEVETGSDIDNEYLALFSSLDISDVIVLVFSLLGLLLAFENISGEKSAGTLKYMLAHPVPRYKFLLGKYIGGIIVINIALFIGILFGLLIVITSKSIMLNLEEWYRIGGFFLLSISYTSTFYLIGMVISANTHHPATSLAFSLFFWIVLVIIWPRSAHYLGQQLKPIPSEETWEKIINSENAQKYKAFQEFEQRYGRYSKAGSFVSITFFESDGIMISRPDEKVIDYFTKRTEYVEPIIRNITDRIWNIILQKQNRLNSQRKLIIIIAALSPTSLYSTASSIISRTDAGSTLRIWDQIREYRRQMLSWFSDNKFISSPKWFTKEGELNLNGFPEFNCQLESFVESYKRVIVPLTIIILMNIILFILLYFAFLTYDVR